MAADAELRLWAVIGASGTGKGLWIKEKLRLMEPPRMAVWDFKNEYGHLQSRPHLCQSLAEVRAAMLEAGADGPAVVRYMPRGAGERALRREFETFCELVYAWERCTFVAEELAMVTTPGWAPAAWRKMCTSGRHAEIHIIGATQSPALVDKVFLGNCTLMHCGPLREESHRQAVARAMDIDPGRVAKLVRFQWIERDWDSGAEQTGWTYPPGGNPGVGATTPTVGSGTSRGAARASRVGRGCAAIGANQSPRGGVPRKAEQTS